MMEPSRLTPTRRMFPCVRGNELGSPGEDRSHATMTLIPRRPDDAPPVQTHCRVAPVAVLRAGQLLDLLARLPVAQRVTADLRQGAPPAGAPHDRGIDRRLPGRRILPLGASGVPP